MSKDFNAPSMPPTPYAELTADSTLKQIVEEDVAIANSVLKALYHTWGQVKSVRHVCEMARTTMDVVQKRRDLLIKPASYSDLNRIPEKKLDELPFEIL
jgi:hypothetical protein